MQKITPCLWFNDNAQQAVAFYLSVFGGEEVDRLYYNRTGPGLKGQYCRLPSRSKGKSLLH